MHLDRVFVKVELHLSASAFYSSQENIALSYFFFMDIFAVDTLLTFSGLGVVLVLSPFRSPSLDLF